MRPSVRPAPAGPAPATPGRGASKGMAKPSKRKVAASGAAGSNEMVISQLRELGEAPA